MANTQFLYNLSLETGVFPNCWKMSRSIPIYFLPGRNVMKAITKLLNYILSAINNNESVLFIMLDISKAYDTCIDYI